jgi:hypothetical protein
MAFLTLGVMEMAKTPEDFEKQDPVNQNFFSKDSEIDPALSGREARIVRVKSLLAKGGRLSMEKAEALYWVKAKGDYKENKNDTTTWPQFVEQEFHMRGQEASVLVRTYDYFRSRQIYWKEIKDVDFYKLVLMSRYGNTDKQNIKERVIQAQMMLSDDFKDMLQGVSKSVSAKCTKKTRPLHWTDDQKAYVIGVAKQHHVPTDKASLSDILFDMAKALDEVSLEPKGDLIQHMKMIGKEAAQAALAQAFNS